MSHHCTPFCEGKPYVLLDPSKPVPAHLEPGTHILTKVI